MIFFTIQKPDAYSFLSGDFGAPPADGSIEVRQYIKINNFLAVDEKIKFTTSGGIGGYGMIEAFKNPFT